MCSTTLRRRRRTHRRARPIGLSYRQRTRRLAAGAPPPKGSLCLSTPLRTPPRPLPSHHRGPAATAVGAGEGLAAAWPQGRAPLRVLWIVTAITIPVPLLLLSRALASALGILAASPRMPLAPLRYILPSRLVGRAQRSPWGSAPASGLVSAGAAGARAEAAAPHTQGARARAANAAQRHIVCRRLSSRRGQAATTKALAVATIGATRGAQRLTLIVVSRRHLI